MIFFLSNFKSLINCFSSSVNLPPPKAITLKSFIKIFEYETAFNNLMKFL